MRLHRSLHPGIAAIGLMALAGSASAVPGTATVSLLPNKACYQNAETVVVAVKMTAATVPVYGGQFYIHFDNTHLAFDSVTFGDSPFTNQLQSDNTGTPNLFYADGIQTMGSGTASDTVMARFTFHATAEICSTSGLVSFQPDDGNGHVTVLSDADSNPLMLTLNGLSSISVDSTAPVVTCPPAISVTSNANAPCGTAYAARALTPGWRTDGDTALVDDSRPGNDLALQVNAVPPFPPYDAAVLTYTFSSPPLFPSLTTLSADYRVLSGLFGGGSPRFVVHLDNDGDGVSDTSLDGFWENNTPPGYNDGNWHSTGELATRPFDVRGQGGYLYQASRASLDVTFATSRVLSVSLVVDAAWFSSQQFLVDHVNVGGNVQDFNATASDTCGGSSTTIGSGVTITGVRDDGHALTDPYTQPLTVITWSATDCAGNASGSCVQDVVVTPFNEVDLYVELAGVSNASTIHRCVTLDLHTAGCATQSVDVDVAFRHGAGSAIAQVPCDAYTQATARDRLHTLRRTADASHFGLTTSFLNTTFGPGGGGAYFAAFEDDSMSHAWNAVGNDALVSGNLNDDRFIDILDFGGLVSRFGALDLASTPCGTPGIHPDFTGDGMVSSDDYTFISTQFLFSREPDCVGALNEPGPTTDISVFDLALTDYEMARTADLNRDGRLNMDDIAYLGQHGLHRCVADFNSDGSVSVQDIFSFINNWFSGYPAADINDDHHVSVQDIFSFLGAWFQGCP